MLRQCSGFPVFKQVNSCNYLPIYLVSWLEEAKTAVELQGLARGLDLEQQIQGLFATP